MPLANYKIYADSGLTTEITANEVINHHNDGSTGNVDRSYYIGNVTSLKGLQTTVNPGVDQINIALSDSDPAGSTPVVTDYKLALTLLGLNTAIAGDPLDLGVSASEGVSGSLEFFVRAIKPAGAAINISLTTNDLTEA